MWSISSSSLDIDLRWCSRGETCLLYENLSLRKGNLSLKSAGSAILDCFFLASSEDVMNIFYPLAWLASSDAFGPNWSYNSVSSWSFFLSSFSIFSRFHVEVILFDLQSVPSNQPFHISAVEWSIRRGISQLFDPFPLRKIMHWNQKTWI